MGESIAAVGYIAAGSILLFMVAARLARGIVDRDTLIVWGASWFAATVALFLTRNFFVFAGALFVISYVARRKLPEGQGIYLYLVLMLVAPTFVVRMPGFAGINTLLDLTPQRILAMALLLPAVKLALQAPAPERLRFIDKLVAVLVLLYAGLSYRYFEATATDTVRRAISHILDIGLPYFVFSRLMHDAADVRKGFFALAFGALPFPVIGLLEMTRTWRMYNPIAEGWGVQLIQSYLFRDGMLRAAGPAVEAIAFGFVCMVGMGCLLMYMDRNRNIFSLGLVATFGVGLIVSLSRGPWVGAAVMVAVYVIARPKAISNTLRSAMIGMLLLVPVFMSPMGDEIVRYLPFIGTVENNNVEYRQDLIDNSMAVIGRYPFFGSANFLLEPEMLSMRQGQGIIDVVNSYVAIALEFGLVTLGVFLLIFGLLFAVTFRTAYRPGEIGDMARVWVALMAGTLVTIATVSSISFIPCIYWALAGFGAAICRARATTGEALPATAHTAPAEMQIIGPGIHGRPSPMPGAGLALAPNAKGSL